MPRILLLLLLWSLGRVSAQTGGHRLGFDLGLSPAYVLFDPIRTDNWPGDKPLYATMVVGTIDWTTNSDNGMVGLGGGAFIWGDRILYPVYLQLGLHASILYRDTTKVSPCVRRFSGLLRVGTMLGTIETAAGNLNPEVWYNAAILYRLSRSTRSSWHIGIELGMYTWGGPYQVRTGDTWEEGQPRISTVGPVVQFRF